MLAWGTLAPTSVVTDSCQDANVWPARPAIRSMFRLGNPRGAQALQVLEHHGPAVEAAALLGFAIDKGLNAEADAIDACPSQRIKRCIGNLARGALDCDLGIGLDRELCADGCEELGDQIRFKQARCSATEIDGVDAGRRSARRFSLHWRAPCISSMRRWM